jgi:hypothetical protein
MSIGEMIPPNTPFEFSGLDVRPSFRASSDGSHVYSVNFMVTEEVWNALKTIPRHRIVGGVLCWTEDGDDAPLDLKIKKPTKKEAKRRGPFSSYWQEMFKAGFQHNFDLLEVLPRLESQSVKEAIKSLFMVQSMTEIEPANFESWCKRKGLTGLVTLSRQAQAKANGS